MTTQRGFTLIEMAIVLVILTFLIGGLAMPLAAQIQARRIAETRQIMADARDALIGYAMTHQETGRPYLPCPADNVNGVESTRDGAGDCSADEGFLPWATLGTAHQDAWGNRLKYRVTKAFSNSNGFQIASAGDLRVCNDSTCMSLIADSVPVVLVSYGPNGYGARNISGSTLAAPTSANELENTDTDIEFVSRPPSKAGEFDDLVIWISDSLLRSRVCPAGGCP
ncbi:MAG: prepilin-type N-terminal cleavage/methylation domain-containing protein [Thiobacillus sp.]|nr:prepilin-type N-terminal cleavage/methylation domain-containing protein [Thiobacillus sp.]